MEAERNGVSFNEPRPPQVGQTQEEFEKALGDSDLTDEERCYFLNRIGKEMAKSRK